MEATKIAKVCHEVNRVITDFVGDVPVQLAWEDCSADMQASCIKGVQFTLEHPEATPERQHAAWMEERIAQGWMFGETKDAEKKTHPALRPYSELPGGVRLKDAVFQTIVRALAGA